jgi:hypothetical protein
MSNITITNNDLGSVILKNAEHRDYILDALAAKVYPEGTILALNVAGDKLIPYVKGGAVPGAGKAAYVMTYDVDATAATGDYPLRAMISGCVRKERLIIDADGDASNIDDGVIDLLKDNGIDAIDVQELNILDNQ